MTDDTDNRVQQRGPEGNLEEYDPSNAVEDLHQEVARLRARIEAAHKACGEAVTAALEPRKGVPEARQWDDGYKNGVQACASVVWAALTHRRV